MLRHFYGTQFEVYSAGAKPSFVHPLAIKVMTELGIDISEQKSKSVETFHNQDFDYVITLCGEACPLFTGKVKKILHWSFIDPAESKGNEEQVLMIFRKVRDEIKAKIEEFVIENKKEVKL
ncbi:MAG: arsenate reductase ArsC [Elusimicrobiales bacterium]